MATVIVGRQHFKLETLRCGHVLRCEFSRCCCCCRNLPDLVLGAGSCNKKHEAVSICQLNHSQAGGIARTLAGFTDTTGATSTTQGLIHIQPSVCVLVASRLHHACDEGQQLLPEVSHQARTLPQQRLHVFMSEPQAAYVVVQCRQGRITGGQHLRQAQTHSTACV